MEGYGRKLPYSAKIGGILRKRKSPKTLDITRVFGHGAGGGTRTHTLSPAKDFESSSSANSNTPARLFLKSLLKITNRKLEEYAGGMLRRNTVFSFQKFPVYQGLSYPAWETAKSILSPSRLPIPSLRPIWYIVACRFRKSKQKAKDGARFLHVLRLYSPFRQRYSAPVAGCCSVSGSIGVTYVSSIRCSAISST